MASYPSDRPKLTPLASSKPIQHTYCCDKCNQQLDEKLIDKIKKDVGLYDNNDDRFVLTKKELLAALDNKQCPARFTNGILTELNNVSDMFDLSIERNIEPLTEFWKSLKKEQLAAVLMMLPLQMLT